VLSLAADQATKLWARAVLKPIYPQVKTVIPGYWEFRYAENMGSAFSIVRNQPLILGLVGLVALGGIIFYLYRADPKRRFGAIAIGLLAGGAVGNLIDRLGRGAVTDFVVWRVGSHAWPTFNVADAVLLIGIAGLFFEPRSPSGAAART
jgi:signal peptidase II